MTTNNPAAWDAIHRDNLRPKPDPKRWELCQYSGVGPGANILGDIHGKRVLELGCGDGANLSVLSGLGGLCTGVDFSPQAIGQAMKRTGSDQITWVCAEATEFLNNSEDQFDVVVSIFGALEFTGVSLLPLITNRLSPKGKLLIVTADPLWLKANDHEPSTVRRPPGQYLVGFGAWNHELRQHKLSLLEYKAVGPNGTTSAHILVAQHANNCLYGRLLLQRMQPAIFYRRLIWPRGDFALTVVFWYETR